MNHDPNYIPTKEIGELLEIVSDKVPKLLSDLMRILYSEEAGANLGKAMGTFYKQLTESGIPSEEALKMTKDYMNLVPKTILSSQLPGVYSPDDFN